MNKIINFSKLFDVARDFYAGLSYRDPSGRALMPLRYFFELTYRCNLNCPYCYVGQERNKDELSTQEWFDVIEQIPFYSLVTLVGGEPLLRKDFIQILEKTAKKTFGKAHVVTNGILITDEIIDAFIRTKMMLLSVSLDGFGPNHDKNRAREGIFDKIITNLDNLNSRKKRPMVDIKTIVLPNNLDDLPKLYKLTQDMGFEFLSVSFLRNNNLKQNSVLHDRFIEEFNQVRYPIKPYFDMEHFKEIYKEIESMSKNSSVQLRFSPKFETAADPLGKIEEFFNFDAQKPIQEIYTPCKYPLSNMMINPQGDVYPCLSQKVGNIKTQSVKQAFNTPHYCCFRKNLKANGGVFEACQMCCELGIKS